MLVVKMGQDGHDRGAKVIATAFASAYLTWRLGSTLVQSAIIGVSTALGIYVIFHLVLGLSLARGPLGF